MGSAAKRSVSQGNWQYRHVATWPSSTSSCKRCAGEPFGMHHALPLRAIDDAMPAAHHACKQSVTPAQHVGCPGKVSCWPKWSRRRPAAQL